MSNPTGRRVADPAETHGRWPRARTAAVTLVSAALLQAAVAGCFRPSPAPYTPHDPSVATFPLFFYPSAVAGTPAKAFIFFVGNDIGFWGAHQELAKRLAGAGYDVVGLDVKNFFGRLPDDAAQRAALFRDSVAAMIALSRHELNADSIPLVLGGHSLGAEIASWIAVNAPPPRLASLLLISSRSRGHLRATLADIANRSVPTEPGSYSVAENIAALPASVRIAIVRGTDDRYRSADSALLAAGGPRIDKWSVPWGGHSMSNILLAGPFVERALSWTLQR